jgi:hypothetical protein
MSDLKRFVVTFATFDGRTTSYSVVVWNGRDKAVALATATHVLRHPKDDLFVVSVEEMGSPDQNPDGTPVLQGDELVDAASGESTPLHCSAGTVAPRRPPD